MKRMYLLLFMGCLVACTKIEIENRPTEGEVNLSVDWTDKVVPAGMRFYFYRMEGDVTTRTGNSPVIRDASASGFAGSLPIGTYQMLAVNTDGKGTELTGMENYGTATAVLKDVTGKMSSFYCWSMDSLQVDYNVAAKKSCAPTQLTKELSFQFALEGTGLRSLSGSLCGVYPSVQLATGVPSTQSVADAPATEVRFDVALNGVTGYANFLTFGVLDPRNGSAYRQQLLLTATTLSGKTQELKVDLSRDMTEILKEYGGTLPVNVAVEVDVAVEAGADAGLTARITGWQPATGKGEVNE